MSGRLFARDRTGATAVEFALVALPSLLVILVVLQVGIYFMTKSALDSGVILTAEAIRKQFNSGTTPLNPTDCAALRLAVSSNSGTFVTNDPTMLFVDIQRITNLTAGSVAVSCVTPDYGQTGSPGDVVVLRAKYTPSSFMPGFGPTITIYSSALVRRLLE